MDMFSAGFAAGVAFTTVGLLIALYLATREAIVEDLSDSDFDVTYD